MATIGFIGLGIMGRPMAKNLMKAGHSLIAFDAFATAALDDVVAAGAKRAASSKDVAAQAPILITMVPDGPQVEESRRCRFSGRWYWERSRSVGFFWRSTLPEEFLRCCPFTMSLR